MDYDLYILYWDRLTVHIWLFTSSFGIIFAFLSFLQETGALKNTLDNIGNCTNIIEYRNCYGKGLVSIFVGFVFYLVVGLRHLHGAEHMLRR